MSVTPPANVGYGTVVGRFILDMPDSIDAGDDPDFSALSGKITFTLNVSEVRDATAAPVPVTILRNTIPGLLDSEGYLCTPDPTDYSSPGVRGLRLIANNDADLNPNNTAYTATFALVGPDGRPRSKSAVTFQVLEDETIDLTLVGNIPVAPVIGVPAAESAAAAAASSALEAGSAAVEAAASLANLDPTAAALVYDDASDLSGALSAKIALAGSKSAEFYSQDTAPEVDDYYYWTGTPDASPSEHVINGETITNLANDPRATVINRSGTTGYWTSRWFGSGGTGTHTTITATDGPFPGTSTYLRKQWTAAPTGNGETGFSHGQYLNVTPGDTIFLSSMMRASRGGINLRSRIYWRDGSGVLLAPASSDGPLFPTVAGEWIEVSETFLVPPGAARGTLVSDVVDGPVWQIGDTLDGTALLAVENPASTPIDYFDGYSKGAADRVLWVDTSDGGNTLTRFVQGAWVVLSNALGDGIDPSVAALLDDPESATALKVSAKIAGAPVGSATQEQLNLKASNASRTHVTPQQFGAVGDGIADDTVAVQGALNDARPTFFPWGTYLCSDLVDTSGAGVFGGGMNASRIKAKPGTTILYTATDKTGKPIRDLWFDGGGVAETCLDTDWTGGGVAPSQGNPYANLRVSGYTSIGWTARSNNDSPFDNVLIEASSGATLSLRLNASGGEVKLESCRFGLPFELGCQIANIVGGFYQGMVMTGTDWNTLTITGGYWYANPTTHNNIDIAVGSRVMAGSILGGHFENSHTDGALIGGVGALYGTTRFEGGHLFSTAVGGGLKVVSSTVTATGARPKVVVHEAFLEGVSLTNVNSSITLAPIGCINDGTYDLSTRLGAFDSSDGGGETFLTGSGIQSWTKNIGTRSLLKRSISTINNGATQVYGGLPRAGMIHVKNINPGGSSVLAYYTRIGSSAGDVTVIASKIGTTGETITVSVPSGGVQDQFTTSVSVNHDGAVPNIYAYNVIGF